MYCRDPFLCGRYFCCCLYDGKQYGTGPWNRLRARPILLYRYSWLAKIFPARPLRKSGSFRSSHLYVFCLGILDVPALDISGPKAEVIGPDIFSLSQLFQDPVHIFILSDHHQVLIFPDHIVCRWHQLCPLSFFGGQNTDAVLVPDG